MIAKIGEKLDVRRVAFVSAPTAVGSYVHTDNKKAALVAVEGGDAELARDLAMQVVAASPRYLTPADAPAEHVAKEREIETAKALAEGKPAEIVAKMIEGRLRKSINEFALTGQVFVKDGDLTIEKLLKNNKASVKSFERFEVGAGHRKAPGRLRRRSHGAGEGADEDRRQEVGWQRPAGNQALVDTKTPPFAGFSLWQSGGTNDRAV